MTRAALYLRQSKADDEGVERQEERARALAAARGWSVAAVFIDNDVSASKTRGPKTEWGKMLATSTSYDVVIGTDLDRMVRSTRDINTLIDHGLMLVTIDGEIDLTTADGEFRAPMLASIARFEVRRKGERQRRANEQRAKKGVPHKGARLTGYNADNSVIEEEAVVVRRIFAEFADRESIYSITKRLNEEGVPSRGERWTTSTVATMLRNQRYAGRRVYKGEVVAKGEWKALVTTDEFDFVQSIFAEPDRVKNNGDTSRKHLGSGLFRCDICFQPMKSAARTYACTDCGMYRTITPIDARVTDFMVKVLSIPEVAPLISPPTTDDGKHLAEESKRLRTRLAVIESEYDAGNIDGTRFRVASEKVRVELDAVEKKRFALMGSNVLGGVLGAPDPAQAFLDASLEVKRAIIKSLIFVRIKKAQRGRKGFDPESVHIYFKNYIVKPDGVAVPEMPEESWRLLQELVS